VIFKQSFTEITIFIALYLPQTPNQPQQRPHNSAGVGAGNHVTTSSLFLQMYPSALINKKAELYRKDDRAMRPIYGCLKNFESPWIRPRLLSLKFLMGFCSDRYYECSYKIWSS